MTKTQVALAIATYGFTSFWLGIYIGYKIGKRL